MAVLSLVWGILSMVGLVIAFLPCLGSLNWLNIPFAAIGLGISIFAMNQVPGVEQGKARTGAILCGIAVVLGFLRLIAGGGIF